MNPGTRLGPYEVTAPIGAGGMGEVYRATDTNLKRQVAIKVLPPTFAADADRLARFQREAEVLLGLTTATASAADTKITILSDPPGAMVYGTGIDGIERPFGYAPIIITVVLAKTKDGCRDTGQMRVHWVSGAEASVPSLHVCKKTPGKTPGSRG